MIRLVASLSLLIAVAAAATAAERASRRQKPPHYRITAQIAPLEGRLRATVRVPRADGAVEFPLDLRLHVTAARCGDRELAAVAAGGRWRVEVDDRPCRALEVDYGGTLAPATASASPSFIGAEGTMLIGDWFPRLDGRPLTFELEVTVADGHVAVAPGAPLDERRDAGRYRARFATAAAVDDVPLLAGPYRIGAIERDGLPIRTYLHEEGARFSALYLTKSAGYVDRYRAAIGAYPYSAFHVVSSPLPVGYGFPAIAYLSRRIVPLPYVPDTSLAHEVLHNWWGNAVRVAAGSGNWAEGLTTFQSDYRLTAERDATAGRDMRLRWLREYAVLPRRREFTLAEFRGREHTASQVVGYHKAAFVFLMLRDAIGADPFAAALRAFYDEYRGDSAGWTDLRRHFEAAAGRDLQRFFGQWVERRGAPALQLREARRGSNRGRNSLRLTLAQSEPVYDLQIPIAVETDAGVQRRRIHLQTAVATVDVPLEAAPTRIDVDPDLRVFRRLAAEEVPPILREVAFDETAATVVAGDGDALRGIALAIAERFFERPPRLATAGAAAAAPALLVVGTSKAVAAARQELALPQPPGDLPDGTARAWAARDDGGRAIAVVEADDGAALGAILAPLPHYGAQSYVVFDGRRAVTKGLWRPRHSPLSMVLE